jgi:hypothetical protein
VLYLEITDKEGRIKTIETGVSESVIGRFLRKKRSIQIGTAEKLGRAVGATLRAEKG